MSDNKTNFWQDDSGAAMLEFTAAAFTFFILLFGVIEFSNVYYQWNAATKATQLGARLAAVTTPVMDDFGGMTDTVANHLPGDPLPSGAYDVVCNGSTGTCTCSAAADLSCPSTVTFDPDVMGTIVFGRCDDPTDSTEACNSDGFREKCFAGSSFHNIGMCNVFGRVDVANVIIRYQYTGLGYTGRPGGPVPTITVSLKMNYQFTLLSSFLGSDSIPMPSFATTVTGEDLNVSWSG